MNTRVRIDLAQGVVEAEGSEEFVRAIYSDFKDRLTSQVRLHHQNDPANEGREKKRTSLKPSAGNGADKARTSKARSKNPQIVGDLDLSGKGAKISLRDFYARYQPANNFENNLVFVYHLKQELKIKTVSVDHVFTCYRNIPKLKLPEALAQSVLDTKNRKGWIDTSSLDDIQLNMSGINYLEHDMKKAEKSKAEVT